MDAELAIAKSLEASARAESSFKHLERAHVLGQASTVQHVRVHFEMLRWAWRKGRASEALGQVIRIIGAATKTAAGWVPTGNTGGANVSPFKVMPVPQDLKEIIRSAAKPNT
ncbi:hypothetical protein ABIE13_000640 [Ottowia thiooxydans]|uniref:DUF3703 domain-containing protein n=1 Tax=Ottowia thiooxydans TaxID=219182 RepID=A0ABV2Q3E2_9BURK